MSTAADLTSASTAAGASASTLPAQYELEDGSMFDPMFIPAHLSSFLLVLREQVFVRNVEAIHALYEVDLPKVVEESLSSQPWPAPDAVVELFRHSQAHETLPDDAAVATAVQQSYELTSVLYKFFYYRHLLNTQSGSAGGTGATVHDRFAAFQAFIDLFNVLLEQPTTVITSSMQTPIAAADAAAAAADASTDASNSPTATTTTMITIAPLALPNVLCWDMIEAFIQQFEDFHTLRHNVKQLTVDDMNALRVEQVAWQPGTVLRYLHAFARKAMIDVLKPFDLKAAEQRVCPLFIYFGQCALLALLRVHILLGNYQSALESLDPVELRVFRAMHSSVPTCYVSMHYYIASSLFMLRRYTDCLRFLVSFVSYVERNKVVLSRGSQPARVAKYYEQALGVLALAYSLSPEYIEENVQKEMKEKYEDAMSRMLKGDASAFEEVYMSALPRPVVTTLPDYSSTSTAPASSYSHADHRDLHWRLVQSDIAQRLQLSAVVSNLRQFSSTSVSRLARSLDVTDDDRVLSMLSSIVQRSRQLVWSGGAMSSGRFAYQPVGAEAKDRERNRDGTFSDGVIEFVVDRNAISVVSTKSVRRYGDFFVKQASSLNQLGDEIVALHRGGAAGSTGGSSGSSQAGGSSGGRSGARSGGGGHWNNNNNNNSNNNA